MHFQDSSLIEACLAGDQSAWSTLVDRYGRLVYSIPRRYGLQGDDAEDVFQAVFLNLHRSLASLKDRTRLSAWLITAAHRESWRVGKRSDRYSQLDDLIHDISTPDEAQAVRWEQQHLVRQAVKSLGGRCEELLTALFLDPDSPSYEQISARIGIPLGSIGPTRARCFRKLEEALAALGFEP